MEFKDTVKLLNIKHEYVEKQTPEDNEDIELFNNSLKTDYIWQNYLESYIDAVELMEYAFNDYNNYGLHSFIGYLTPIEIEKQWNSSQDFRNKFMEERKKGRKEIKQQENSYMEEERKCLNLTLKNCPKLSRTEQ